MSAYSDLYIGDAKKHLSTMFDYAINTCGFDADFFASLFAKSEVSKQFAQGNPFYVAGMSGFELAQNVVDECYGKKELAEPVYYREKSAEYWAGWSLAQFQWESGEGFEDIFKAVPFSEMVSMYPLYHEMDIAHFNERMSELLCVRR